MDQLIITRSLKQGKEFADRLCESIPSLAADRIILEPLLEIKFIPVLQDVSKSCDALILTSVNAIPAALKYSGYDKPLYCVGEATAQAAREHGIVNIKAVSATVDELINRIQKESKKLHFYYFRGEYVSEEVGSILNASGYRVDEYRCYDAVAAQSFSSDFIELVKTGKPYVLVFFSKRTANIFSKLVSCGVGVNKVRHPKVLCISDNVLESMPYYLQKNAYRANTPDMKGMLDLIRVHLV